MINKLKTFYMKNLILIFCLFSYQLTSAFAGNPGNEDFLKFFEKFKTDFNSKNISSLNEYIDPEHGIFVLDNPGAFINCYYFSSFDPVLNSSKETDLYRIKNLKINCEPAEGSLPQYNCESDKEGWDKDGCYFNNTPEKNFNSRVYGYADDNGNYGFEGDGNENGVYKIIREKSERSSDKFKYSFYTTDSNMGLYFGESDGKFFLLMIDLVTPCDA